MYNEKRQKIRRTMILKRVNKIKREMKGCQKCGYRVRPVICEFHHPDKRTKLFTISKNNFNRSWEAIKKEISKCRLLCPNCHKELHHKRRTKMK